MSWDRPSDAAAEAVLWGILESAAKARKDEARAWLTKRMGPDAAAVKAIAGGETIGRATWVEPNPALTVVDATEFISWIGDHYPDELVHVVEVNWAFKQALLSHAKIIDGVVMDRNGIPIPGVEMRGSAPYVSVRKSGQARATVEELLTAGRLQLDGIRALEEGPS